MLDFINKKEYFEWLDKGIADVGNIGLKGIQDGWILSILDKKKGLKVAEVGGGNSRVLKTLSLDNECWNIDKFEGAGNGPSKIAKISGVNVVRTYLGDFDEDLPDGYFDVLFSISVIEHVPKDKINDFFADCHRLLKPGGVMLHAIDLYVSDSQSERVRIIDRYKEAIDSLDYEWFLPPCIDGNATFQCKYASNSDIGLNAWNKSAPGLRSVREVTQSISIKMFAFKGSSHVQKSGQGFLDAAELVALKNNSWDNRTIQRAESQTFLPPKEQDADVGKAVATASGQNLDAKRDDAATSLLGRILSYYSRWPVAIALIALSLFITAFFLDQPLNLICAGGSLLTLLFLIGHAASKADYVLRELQKTNSDNQKAIAKLESQIARIDKRESRTKKRKKR